MTAAEEYFEYLRGRSCIGKLYRKYWLYPRLCFYLNGKTLDVGCGIGDFLTYCTETVGVDINPITIEWCRRKKLDVYLMSPDVLPFEDNSFDSVILDNVLEHLMDPIPLLAEIHRVLRSHGPLVVGVPGSRGYTMDNDHKVFYDEKLLVSTLARARFQLRKLLHMPLRSPWLDTNLRQYCLYGVFERD